MATIMTALTFLKSYWKIIAISAVVLGGFLYWRNLVNTIDELERDNFILQRNNAVLEEQIQSQREIMDEFRANAEIAERENRDLSEIRGQIDNAKEPTGALPPVLSRTIDGLRRLEPGSN